MENDPLVWFDETNGIVFNTGKPASTVEAARDTLRRAAQLMEGKPRRLLLVDLTDAPLTLSSEVRETLSEESRNLKLDRQAFVVANPVLRMLAKTISRVTGASAKSGFFGTVDQAVAWLKEET